MISFLISLCGDLFEAVFLGGMFDLLMILLIFVSGIVVIKNIRQAIL